MDQINPFWGLNSKRTLGFCWIFPNCYQPSPFLIKKYCSEIHGSTSVLGREPPDKSKKTTTNFDHRFNFSCLYYMCRWWLLYHRNLAFAVWKSKLKAEIILLFQTEGANKKKITAKFWVEEMIPGFWLFLFIISGDLCSWFFFFFRFDFIQICLRNYFKTVEVFSEFTVVFKKKWTPFNTASWLIKFTVMTVVYIVFKMHLPLPTSPPVLSKSYFFLVHLFAEAGWLSNDLYRCPKGI